MNFNTILFDMDGVLVLSEPLHYQAWINVIKNIGLDGNSLKEEDVIGYTDRQISDNLIQRLNLDLESDQLLSRKTEAFLSVMKNGIPKVAGLQRFLNKYAGNKKMAVISSSNRKEIEAVLKYGELSSYFPFFIGFEDTVLHKPDPQPYFTAMKKINSNPEETLIIEDSPSGVQAALATGSKVVGLNTSELLTDEWPVTLVNNYDELLQVIENE